MTEIHDEGQGALLGDIPSDNLNSTLDNYDPSLNTHYEEGLYALRLASAFVEVEAGKPAGLLLTGEPGNGKTHLAVGIGRAIADQGGKAAFTSFAGNNWDLNTVPGGIPGSGWYAFPESFVTEHDVLIFDDLPGDIAPGWRKLLQEFVMTSYNQGKRVVMTSNQPAPKIIEQLARPAQGSTGAVDVGPALKERIRQTWSLVEFHGESFRSGQDKWHGGIERPEGSPTIDQAVRAAGTLEMEHKETTLLRALAAAFLPILVKEGVPSPQIQAVKDALGWPKGK